MEHLKRRLIWWHFLWAAFSILIINDWHNIKHWHSFVSEMKKLLKKQSVYTEDSDYVIIHKKEL